MSHPVDFTDNVFDKIPGDWMHLQAMRDFRRTVVGDTSNLKCDYLILDLIDICRRLSPGRGNLFHRSSVPLPAPEPFRFTPEAPPETPVTGTLRAHSGGVAALLEAPVPRKG